MNMQDVRILACSHRGQKAVALENDAIQAVILPERGGKTASVFYKPGNFELLAQPKGEYPLLVSGMDFSKGDASGFDDAFPGIDPETADVGEEEISYPDHGEVWTLPFEAAALDEGVLLKAESSILPYRYEKEIRMEGKKLIYRYAITHTGGKPFPCLWACHCLVRYEPDMRLSYPKGMEYAENVLQSDLLGAPGTHHLLRGGVYDFDTVPAPDSGTMVKYYLQGRCPEGRCGFRYPSQGVQCDLEFDAEKLPYLGFWLTAGGYRGEYNCAFEPATSYYDSISRVQANQTVCFLHSGQSMSFSLTPSA